MPTRVQQERRLHARAALPMRVRFWTREREDEGECLNASAGGMLLAYPWMLPVGTRLEIEMQPIPSLPRMRLAGEIVRVVDPGGVQRMSLLGVRFAYGASSALGQLVEAARRLGSGVDERDTDVVDDDEFELTVPARPDWAPDTGTILPRVGGRVRVSYPSGRSLDHQYVTTLGPARIFVRTEELLERGDVLDVAIRPADHAEGRRVRGRVARSFSAHSTTTQPAGVEVELVSALDSEHEDDLPELDQEVYPPARV